MTTRKHSSAGFWATVVLVVVLLGYPLSFGPACWISSRVEPSGEIVSAVYRPIIWIWCEMLPKPLFLMVQKYVEFGLEDGTYLALFGEPDAMIEWQ